MRARVRVRVRVRVNPDLVVDVRRAAPRRLVGSVVDGARLAKAPPLKADLVRG